VEPNPKMYVDYWKLSLAVISMTWIGSMRRWTNHEAPPSLVTVAAYTTTVLVHPRHPNQPLSHQFHQRQRLLWSNVAVVSQQEPPCFFRDRMIRQPNLPFHRLYASSSSSSATPPAANTNHALESEEIGRQRQPPQQQQQQQRLDHPIILFDGVCNFCNAWVDILLRIDTNAMYKFTPLQSAMGQQLLTSIGKEKDDISSVVLIAADGQTYYTKSACVLQVVRQLGPVAQIASTVLTRMVPESIRDTIYDTVAENRYSILGERTTCRSGDPKYFDRFIS
jgi:predicted DCC family thiol-disulfide oxidoreductase YuxK